MTDSVSTLGRLRVEIWVFFAVLFVLNTVFVVGTGEEWIDRKYYSRGRLLLLGGTLVGVVLLSRGVRAALDLLKPLLAWRVPPHWFLIALLWPFVFAICFVILRTLVIGGPLQLTNPGGIEFLQRDGVLYRIFIISLVGEIVWVGYAISNLSKFYKLHIAAAITGIFWGLWWLPMVIYTLSVIPGLSFIGLLMNVLGVSFFCAFFYALTRSGIVILLMQFCFNCAVLAIPVLPGIAGVRAFEAFAASYMILGFLAVTVLLPRIQQRQASAPSGTTA